MNNVEKLKEINTKLISLKKEQETINNNIKEQETEMRIIVLNFLNLLVENNLTEIIFINDESTIKDEFSNIKPRINYYTNVVYLAYIYCGEGDEKSISACVIGDYISLNSNNTMNFKNNKKLIQFPIDCIDNVDEIKKIIEDKFNADYNNHRYKKYHESNLKVQYLENELNLAKINLEKNKIDFEK